MHWDHEPMESLVAANHRRMIPPLLGERAGVRESLWVWNILPEMHKCLEINDRIFGSWRISPISRLRIAAMNPCGTARPHVSRRQAVPLKPNTTTGQPVERRAELMQSFSLIRKSARICVICGYSTFGRPAAASLCLDITFRGGNSTNRDSSQILDIAFDGVGLLGVDFIRMS